MGKGKEEMEKKKWKEINCKYIQKNPARNQLKFIFQIFGFNGSWSCGEQFFFFYFFPHGFTLVLCLSCCPYNFTCENWFFFSSGEDFLSFFVKLLICPTRWRAKKKSDFYSQPINSTESEPERGRKKKALNGSWV